MQNRDQPEFEVRAGGFASVSMPPFDRLGDQRLIDGETGEPLEVHIVRDRAWLEGARQVAKGFLHLNDPKHDWQEAGRTRMTQERWKSDQADMIKRVFTEYGW